jgi:hemolysin D
MPSVSAKIFQFPKQSTRRSTHEIAFLPAALELTESPPSPIGRAIGATIVALFCFALAWATFGRVDIVASASGRIVPSGGAKVIQPFETGVVAAIHVRDGQKVKAGEVLIELDPTMTVAEQKHSDEDLVAAQIEVARLRAALEWKPGADSLAMFHPPQGAGAQQAETQRQFLVSQTAEQQAKLAEIDRQLAQKEAERGTVGARIDKLQATVPILQERVDVRKILYDKALGSKLVYLTDYQDLVGMKQDVLVEKNRLREADAALAALRETRKRTETEFRRVIFAELTKAQDRAAGLAQDAVKAARRTGLQKLTAPVDGAVQQLAVHTIGGVVTPAQTLAVVAPTDGSIEIEAMLANRDIGFVRVGQEAEVKVETFNFTRYGLVQGRVLSVSRDAVTAIGPPGKSQDADATAAKSGDGNDEAPKYVARVSLDRTTMAIDGKPEDLSPGMAVTVEIKTGTRRIISYLLSPIEKQGEEALRER